MNPSPCYLLLLLNIGFTASWSPNWRNASNNSSPRRIPSLQFLESLLSLKDVRVPKFVEILSFSSSGCRLLRRQPIRFIRHALESAASPAAWRTTKLRVGNAAARKWRGGGLASDEPGGECHHGCEFAKGNGNS